MTLVACTGTATEIGKTWVGAAVLSTLRARGASVTARKPVQSFESSDTGPTDADVLGAATAEHPTDVCPEHRWLPAALAPPMAAALLARPTFSIADLAAELEWPVPERDIRWVETVGGVRSPIAVDGDSAHLCAALSPDLVVLVADAGLGTINAVRLSVAALAPSPVVVYLNHWTDDQLHQLNRAWLTDRDGFDVIVTIEDLASRLVGALSRRQA